MGINEIVSLVKDESDYKAQAVDLIKSLVGDPDADVQNTALDAIQILQGDTNKEGELSEEEAKLIKESKFDPELEKSLDTQADILSNRLLQLNEKRTLTEGSKTASEIAASKISETMKELTTEQKSKLTERFFEKMIDNVLTKSVLKEDKAEYDVKLQETMKSSMNFNPNLRRAALICYLNIPFLISLMLTIFVWRWEVLVISWIAFLLIVGGVVRAHFNKEHEFQCQFCGDADCKHVGSSNIMFYCNKWTLKPRFLEKWYLIAYFTCIVTVVTGLVNITVVWLPLIPLGLLLGLKYYFSIEKTPVIFYEIPPSHPNSCICKGTGKCPKCEATGLKKIRVIYPRHYHIRFEVCERCRGLRLCPNEVEKVLGDPEKSVPGWAICLWFIVTVSVINLYLIFYYGGF